MAFARTGVRSQESEVRREERGRKRSRRKKFFDQSLSRHDIKP
ncbi:hypothetical protein [Okeania sp. KiyG1]|nr:hypothetical protein [Okeania sp. KiyG1]